MGPRKTLALIDYNGVWALNQGGGHFDYIDNVGILNTDVDVTSPIISGAVKLSTPIGPCVP